MTRRIGSFVLPPPGEAGRIEFRVEEGWLEFKLSTEADSAWEPVFEIPVEQHTTWTELSMSAGRLRYRHANGQGGHSSYVTPNLVFQFQVAGDWLQFRYGTSAAWINALDLSTLGGGGTPEFREHEGWIQWRIADQEPEAEWENLFQLPTQVEFREHEGWVQWRYVGGTWENLFEIPEVTGTGGGVKGLKIAMIGQ